MSRAAHASTFGPTRPRLRLFVVAISLLAATAWTTGCATTGPGEEAAAKAEFHYKLASNFFYDKKPQQCIAELYSALKLDPKHAKAHHLLGFVYFGRHDHVRALKHFQMAVTIDPDFDNALANLGNLYLATAQWEESIPYFERLLNKPLYRTPYLAQNNLGWALFNLERHEEAKRYLRLAVFYNPKFCLAHNNLGRVHAKLGNTRESLMRFHKAIELCPQYAEPHYFLGRIYNALAEERRAYTHFEKCNKLAPETKYGRRCGDRIE